MSEKIPPMSPAGPQSAVAAPTKGRRPRGRVLVIVGALGLLVMVALVYTMYQRQASMATAQRQQVSDDGAAAVPPGDLWAVPDRQAPATSTQPRAASAQATPELDQAAADAFAAPTGVSGFGPKPKAIAPIQAAPRPQIVQLPAAPAAPASGTMVPPLQVDGADPNGQGSKAAFMDRQPIADPYLNAKREAPRSRTELKAGSVIPAIMVGGINSDLPGEIVGQVSRNVYDTATGDYLLVPAGAKVVGVYDSRVVYGQSRVLVAWERIIFPDGSSISIGGMPGTDMGGYSGFSDKVNRHFWPTFRDALFMSVISAGAQLSQPQSANGENYSPSQIAAAALGQQFSQVGSELVSRNMDRQPTLEIRPGYQFNVMLNKDVILPPWRG